jgi:N6-adenosine-specific RNA methylase IME4
MTDDELKRLPIAQLAHPEGAWLFYWDTSPRIDRTLPIARRWGFKRSSVAWYWVKLNVDGTPFQGMGLTTRKNVELCHLFKIGNPKIDHRDVTDTIFAPRREHSRKPDEQYAKIERFCSGPRIELFARTRRRGWHQALSNEADKFKG